MTHKQCISWICISLLLATYMPTYSMEMEQVIVAQNAITPDIEMGITQRPVILEEIPDAQVLIEEPHSVNGWCISKHSLLTILQGACVTGIIFTKDMPIVPIIIGFCEAVLLGSQVYQIYDDCKSVPANKNLRAQFAQNLQKQGTCTALGIEHRPIPFDVVDQVAYAARKQKKHVTESTLQDYTITPVLSTLTKRDRKERTQKLITLLLCLKRIHSTLPKDIGYTLISYMPELIDSKKLFCTVLPYCNEANFKKIITNCPISWFNYQYNAINDAHKKEAFAHESAFGMAQAEMTFKQDLFNSNGAQSYDIPNKAAVTQQFYNRYKKQITASLQK